jgi:succinate dehydrogenase / fumarate reductase, membrane anchor subunit
MGSGTHLGAVRGLGSAKHGADHWIKQRVSAVANLGLMIWFIVSLKRLPDFDFGTIGLWLASPLTAIPLAMLIISVFTHFRIGLQVFIEDYVHDDGLKFASLLALTAYTYGLGAIALFSLARIAFSGMPQ